MAVIGSNKVQKNSEITSWALQREPTSCNPSRKMGDLHRPLQDLQEAKRYVRAALFYSVDFLGKLSEFQLLTESSHLCPPLQPLCSWQDTKRNPSRWMPNLLTFDGYKYATTHVVLQVTWLGQKLQVNTSVKNFKTQVTWLSQKLQTWKNCSFQEKNAPPCIRGEHISHRQWINKYFCKVFNHNIKTLFRLCRPVASTCCSIYRIRFHDNIVGTATVSVRPHKRKKNSSFSIFGVHPDGQFCHQVTETNSKNVNTNTRDWPDERIDHQRILSSVYAETFGGKEKPKKQIRRSNFKFSGVDTRVPSAVGDLIWCSRAAGWSEDPSTS